LTNAFLRKRRKIQRQNFFNSKIRLPL